MTLEQLVVIFTMIYQTN